MKAHAATPTIRRGADAFPRMVIRCSIEYMERVKDHAIEAIRQLPDDASYEDIMERLLFMQKVELGLQDIRDGRTASHEEVRERLAKWLA